MKKILTFVSAAILLISCGSEKYDNWNDPQASEAEQSKTVTFSATGATSTIDFANVTTDSVTLFTPALVSADEVASQTLTTTLYNAAKTSNYVLNASTAGKVKASELQAAVEYLYGKAGDLRTISADVKNVVLLSRGEGFTFTAPITVKVQLVKPAFAEFIYEIGNESSWQKVQPLRSAEMDGNYLGYGYLNGDFKFRSQENSWDAPDWGMGSAAGSLAQSGGNITAPAAGFYRIEASLANGTYTLTALNLGIVGSGAGSWDVDQDMTYNVTDRVWEWTGALVDGEIKFRANDAWDYNWGGDAANLTQGGANIAVTAGNYTIKLYLTYDGNHKAVITKN